MKVEIATTHLQAKEPFKYIFFLEFGFQSLSFINLLVEQALEKYKCEIHI